MERFNHPELAKEFGKSGAHADFEDYLDHLKPANQYIVFLIRPSGIGMFKDLVDVARKKSFEVGFDALEENQEIHFTAPPPLDGDESVPAKKQDMPAGTQPRATRSVGPIDTNTPTAPEATAPEIGSSTNPAPPSPPAKPPPPPQPKSWWQRVLEWLGIG
jgi:hypothetical protein